MENGERNRNYSLNDGDKFCEKLDKNSKNGVISYLKKAMTKTVAGY